VPGAPVKLLSLAQFIAPGQRPGIRAVMPLDYENWNYLLLGMNEDRPELRAFWQQ
jgi:hypothetical protein